MLVVLRPLSRRAFMLKFPSDVPPVSVSGVDRRNRRYSSKWRRTSTGCRTWQPSWCAILRLLCGSRACQLHVFCCTAYKLCNNTAVGLQHDVQTTASARGQPLLSTQPAVYISNASTSCCGRGAEVEICCFGPTGKYGHLDKDAPSRRGVSAAGEGHAGAVCVEDRDQ